MAEINHQYLAELVVRTQTGDTNAFAELYAATYKKQFRFACQYLKDEYLAQDALQEVYILVLRNIDKLKEPTLLTSWLNQINFRVCFDMSKKQKRSSSELIDQDFTIYADPSVSSRPEALVLEDEQKELLLREIQKLPPFESKALILKYYKNMKLDAIADAMGCSKSSVKRYLLRGRDSLKRRLKSLEGAP